MGGRLGYVAFRALTCPLRLLPDFIIIGAHRGGTSAFYYHLTGHPSVAAATTKELNFFDKHYHKGTWWYRAHFPFAIQKCYAQTVRRRDLVTGEASPHYLFHPVAAQRVAETLPHVKLIALLRNPVDRAYSQYRRNIYKGWEHVSFEEAVAREARRPCGDQRLDNHFDHHSYLAHGRYSDQLEHWLRLFPRDQFLILRSEDFYADPATALKQALAFLHVSTAELPEQESYAHYDGYSYRPESRDVNELDPSTRQRVAAYFSTYNRRLYELLGRDMGWE